MTYDEKKTIVASLCTNFQQSNLMVKTLAIFISFLMKLSNLYAPLNFQKNLFPKEASFLSKKVICRGVYVKQDTGWGKIGNQWIGET